MGIIESYFIHGAIIETKKGKYTIIGNVYKKYFFIKMINMVDENGKIKRYRLYKIVKKINNGWSLISAITGNRIN